MSEESGVETAPQPQAQRLTLRWARMALIWQLCCTLFGLWACLRCCRGLLLTVLPPPGAQAVVLVHQQQEAL